MFPVCIEWQNVACFRGQHRLDLAAKVHAIIARAVDDAGRSNWLGKSTLLTLIPFALFGWHPKRTIDDWITTGEDELGVKLTLSDGAVIERTKQRGQSIQIRFTAPGGKTLTQKAAQMAIDRHVGLTPADFAATCHFHQKQMAKLVSARAGDRVDIIDGWLQVDIEPVQRMHAVALDELAALTQQQAKAEGDAQRITDEATALGESYGAEDMDAVVAARQADADNAKAKADQLQSQTTQRATWEVQAAQAARFAEVVDEGKKLRADFDALAGAREEALKAVEDDAKARAARDTAQRDLQRAESLDCGEFDGQCPVMGAACPVADGVRASGPAKGVLKGLRAKLADCQKAFQAASDRRREAGERGSQHARIGARLTDLRTEAKRLKPSADTIAKRGAPPPADVLKAGLSEARAAETEAVAALREAKADRDWLKDALAQIRKLRAESERLKRDIDLHREAVAILGREGAQQRVAMLALQQIEAGANALLATAGVALSVRFTWAREGKGAAKVCNQCGTPFPSSTRVKDCPRCGTPRGRHMIEKLDIDLTNESGAAEDLAGIAVQLSASNWLRAKRGTPWGCVCIDEPFGALDATNKRALAVHIATMLRDRFDLALVVAHDRGILDALPAQITIVADATGSRLEGKHEPTEAKDTPRTNTSRTKKRRRIRAAK